MTRKEGIKKSITIEESLRKIGWKTEVEFSGSEASSSFYITVSKELSSGNFMRSFDGKRDIFINDVLEKKIRFSDHELPSYYSPADYECRFDINGASWSALKPKLIKLFKEVV